MKHAYVLTSNTQRFRGGIDAVERRGASEACLVVVDGLPGRGKSYTAQWFAIRNDVPYLRATREWTPSWFLRALLAELRIVPENSFEKMFKQALLALSQRGEHARNNGAFFGVVIDEVDHVVRSSKIMDTIRDLSDLVEVPIILIGMGKVRSALARYPQTASRVAQYVAFEELVPADTRALIAGRCEVAVADDLIDLIHVSAKGYAREVLEAIASVERCCGRLGRAVTIADMAGQTLLNDRATGRPVTVRGE
jgi:hypothetical protein